LSIFSPHPRLGCRPFQGLSLPFSVGPPRIASPRRAIRERRRRRVWPGLPWARPIFSFTMSVITYCAAPVNSFLAPGGGCGAHCERRFLSPMRGRAILWGLSRTHRPAGKRVFVAGARQRAAANASRDRPFAHMALTTCPSSNSHRWLAPLCNYRGSRRPLHEQARGAFPSKLASLGHNRVAPTISRS